MRGRLAAVFAFLAIVAPAFAHRLDEYLQATIVSLEADQIRASMRLIPGVAVSAAVIAATDSNRDGVFSDAEQQTYARRVLHDLALSIDGHALQPRLQSVVFPAASEMKEGTAEIRIDFTADLPPGGSRRTLVIENHHQGQMSVYLMNCLIPQDQRIRVIAQKRNENQSYYRIDYAQSGAGMPVLWRSRVLSALVVFAGVPGMFRLGMHHIAEGTDHLLFLLALLLPAPLLAVRSRWGASGGLRHSLMQIVRVVTAFTIGHSITLALGALGLLSLPERPVEVLIAFSILISAVHALRPLFPGREPLIAAFFGLIHGLAFATTLQNLGVSLSQRLASILGFNLGIESMQLIVVAAILPSLLILSRTPAYSAVRFTSALFAACASLGWMVERLFGVNFSMDLMVGGVAQQGPWIAVCLFVISATVHTYFAPRFTLPSIVSTELRHPTPTAGYNIEAE